MFDKFHVIAHLLKALDDVRKQKHRHLMKQGDTILVGTKFLWLQGKERFDHDAWLEFAQIHESC